MARALLADRAQKLATDGIVWFGITRVSSRFYSLRSMAIGNAFGLAILFYCGDRVLGSRLSQTPRLHYRDTARRGGGGNPPPRSDEEIIFFILSS